MSPRPDVDPATAARIAREYWGLSGEISELPSERDRNFRIGRGAGARVLKIASRADDRALLEWQNRAIIRLAAGGLTPPLVPAVDGSEIVEVADPDGVPLLARMIAFLPGHPLAEATPHRPDLLAEVGAWLARVDLALEGLEGPHPPRDLKWDILRADEVIEARLEFVSDRDARARLERVLERVGHTIRLGRELLPRQVIQNDANDHNVIITAGPWPRVAGIVDLGDMLVGPRIAEPAIAAAYAMLGKPDPLAAGAALIGGYHEVNPISPYWIASLYHLILARLGMSVAIAAEQRAAEPDNAYLGVSESPAWALIARLLETSPALAYCTFRAVCGLEPVKLADRVVGWIEQHADTFHPILDTPLDATTTHVLDLSVESPLVDRPDAPPDPATLAARIEAELAARGASVGLGRYDEARLLYRGPAFEVAGNDGPTCRTRHLGVDLFIPAGSPIHAPLGGTVESVQDNAGRYDYGPTVILRHESPTWPFFTLYGHLDPECLDRLAPGDRLEAGALVGRVGAAPRNGDWPPHLHLQLITSLLDQVGTFPGVARAEEARLWRSLSPDPTSLLRLPDRVVPPPRAGAAQIRDARSERLGPSLSLSYRRPLHIVRGWRQYLYDVDGRAYLDGVNNVAHVGHAHPRVTEVAARQMRLLNTNTRYLHETIVAYAERLAATLPEPLSVCFFVCSGSEANELALRMARVATGARDVIVLDAAYHGNTSSLVEISPYKFDGPGGSGAPEHVHVAPMPDRYRGPYRGDDAGARYAAWIGERADELAESGQGVAAFFAESLLGCGGQIPLPDGFLAGAYTRVRAAGGLCVADEVQVGFGRVGSHFWGFERQGVVPDIVTMGKPMGNGHPLAAVVTTPEIATAFANGMEYFNTFGGNPVSCAIGMTVLDIIEEEGLQPHAAAVGAQLLDGLEGLRARHPLIGDVRGAGLFLGVELVRDRETLEPAAAEAGYIVERMRDRGILLSTDGPLHNVLKLKPPLVFDHADADRLVETLDEILSERALRGRASSGA